MKLLNVVFNTKVYEKANNLLNRTILYQFFILIIFLSNIANSKDPEQINKESITQYPGRCPCLYSIMSNSNNICGKKSAYAKSSGHELLCYVSDIKNKKRKLLEKENVKIIDGDTIHINKKKYRLYGIDAPEINQKCKINKKEYKCGIKSKVFLKSLTSNKEIICKKKDIDKYKRIVAVCFANGENINQIMVKSGWAVAYRYYSKDYIEDEIFAKKNRLGMWKGSFTKPSYWRRKN